MPARLPEPLLLILLLLLTLGACHREKKISGKEFIDREVLVDILVDIHLADGVTNDRVFHRKFDVDSIDILSPILQKHKVSRQEFDTTILVYTRNPELLDQVYNEVLIKLNVMLDENNKKEEKEEETSTLELLPGQYPHL
jgi:Domain of unknown function (DUF4296)